MLFRPDEPLPDLAALINGGGTVECLGSDSIKVASQLQILGVLFGTTLLPYYARIGLNGRDYVTMQ